MAWIKIGDYNVLNANKVKEISVELYGDGTYYIKFSFDKNSSTRSKRFEQYDKCVELFDTVWDAVMNNESIDIS